MKLESDSFNIIDKSNFLELLHFLIKIPSDGQKYQAIFSLYTFAFWNKKFEDVNLKILILNPNNYILSCNIPESELWVEIYNGYSKENLLEEIFKYGLDKVQKIFNEQNLLNKIHNNKTTSIEDVEKNQETSLFWLERSIGKLLSIWKYEKNSVEIISRIGKDNKIESERLIKYFVVIGNEILFDEYLENLIPKENTSYESDYGFVASQPKTITEKINQDSTMTKAFLERYNDILHYKYLIKKGRKIKSNDSDYYKINI